MAVVNRNKGQFSQAGSIQPFVKVGGSVVSHDGFLALDTVYLQADYPVLYDLIGTTFNDAGKGDDNATQFRTPPPKTEWENDTNYEYRIRF